MGLRFLWGWFSIGGLGCGMRGGIGLDWIVIFLE